MNDPTRRLRRELRLVEAYAVLSTVVLAVLVLGAFGRPAGRFDTIDVHRINVVDSAGRGDEDRGLSWSGRELPGGGHRASGALSFEQYRQDEKVALWYHDADGHRGAGLYVWHRPDQPLEDLLPLLMAERRATGARRDSLRKHLSAAARATCGSA